MLTCFHVNEIHVLCSLHISVSVSCGMCLTQSAEKQGNQLHMNVYKMKGQACGGPLKTEVKELKGDLRPAPPYPSRVKTVDKGTQVTPEREAVRNQTDFSPRPLICANSVYIFLALMSCSTLLFENHIFNTYIISGFVNVYLFLLCN